MGLGNNKMSTLKNKRKLLIRQDALCASTESTNHDRLKDIRSASLTPLPSVGQCRSDTHTVLEQRACKSVYVPVVFPKEKFDKVKLVFPKEKFDKVKLVFPKEKFDKVKLVFPKEKFDKVKLVVPKEQFLEDKQYGFVSSILKQY
jgi:hypothetical protein